ncbi:MAG: transposase [Nitrospirae bacterium]|nr:transposase [Nitrospirota bacterium]
MKAYDYSEAGAYFVSICSHGRECLFGDVLDGEIRLNEFGMIVVAVWQNLPEHFSHVELDGFVVMPNHVHGILVINRKGMACHAPTTTTTTTTNRQFARPVAGSLPTIIGSFKSAITRQANQVRNTPGLPVWQRNYYEHVIRDKDELERIRQYVIDNPFQWEMDENHPLNKYAEHRAESQNHIPVNRRGMACHALTKDQNNQTEVRDARADRKCVQGRGI